MRIVRIVLLCAIIISCDGIDAYESDYTEEAETEETATDEQIQPELPKPLVDVPPDTEDEDENEPEEVIYMKDVFKNNGELHLPEWVIGKWRMRETGMIQEVTATGFILSPEASLYPNPVTTAQFIAVDGTSNEEVETGDTERYYIEASGEFLHEASGRKYGGSIRFEFIKDGDTVTLNGSEVVQD